MKIDSIQKNNIRFNGGITKTIQSEIKSCHPEKVSKELSKLSISSNFKDNKIVAWCCGKSIELLHLLNQKYGLNLPLPSGILVEDFNKLNILDIDAPAFCNHAPTLIYKDSPDVIPHNFIFINEYPTENYKGGNIFWDNLDNFSDKNFDTKLAPTDSFLYLFLHEIAHAIHNSNLIDKLGGVKYVNLINKMLSLDFLLEYQNKYGAITSKLCDYASLSPTETIACDLGYRFSQSIENKDFSLRKNPLENSPYVNKPLLKKESEYDKIIRKLFNGKF